MKSILIYLAVFILTDTAIILCGYIGALIVCFLFWTTEPIKQFQDAIWIYIRVVSLVSFFMSFLITTAVKEVLDKYGKRSNRG